MLGESLPDKSTNYLNSRRCFVRWSLEWSNTNDTSGGLVVQLLSITVDAYYAACINLLPMSVVNIEHSVILARRQTKKNDICIGFVWRYIYCHY